MTVDRLKESASVKKTCEEA